MAQSWLFCSDVPNLAGKEFRLMRHGADLSAAQKAFPKKIRSCSSALEKDLARLTPKGRYPIAV